MAESLKAKYFVGNVTASERPQVEELLRRLEITYHWTSMLEMRDMGHVARPPVEFFGLFVPTGIEASAIRQALPSWQQVIKWGNQVPDRDAWKRRADRRPWYRAVLIDGRILDGWRDFGIAVESGRIPARVPPGIYLTVSSPHEARFLSLGPDSPPSQEEFDAMTPQEFEQLWKQATPGWPTT